MNTQKENEYEIINFTFSHNNDEKDLRYEIRNYTYEKKYLISKDDYNKGIKYLKNKQKYQNPYKLFYYYEFDKIIHNEKSNDYVLVTENFLKELGCEENIYYSKFVVEYEYKGKYFIYFNDNQILEISQVTEEKSEDSESDKNGVEEDEKEENKDEETNNKISKIEDKNLEKIILKSLILLYANEKHFQKLLNSPIVDEYEFKDYYLINKDFVDDYLKNAEYKNLCEKLDTEEYSYNGFYFNLDEIIDKLNLSNIKIKSKTYEEKNFYPLINEIDYPKKTKKIKCLDKFIIVHENLFDLLYKCIKPKDYQKEDYKCKLLIGDQTLFIQDKKHENNFLTYRYEHEKFKLFYYFGFDEQLSFYKEVKNHIKGKGLLNYVSEMKLDKDKKDKVQILKDKENNSIGKYLNVRKINNDDIKEIKINLIIERLKKYANAHNLFKSNLYILEKNDLDSLNINKICIKINKEELSCIKVGIILNNDLISLEKKLFLDKISNLIKHEGKKDYKDIKKNLINELSKLDEEYFKNISSEITIYDPNLLKKDSDKDNDYNLINFNIKNNIADSEQIEDLQDCYYFKNKDDYFIIFADRKKLYKINYNEKDDNFKLVEYNSDEDKKAQKKKEDKAYEKLAKKIKDLKDSDEKIEKKLNSKFDNFLSMDYYYLVSSKWLQELKKHFKDENKKVELSDLLFENSNLKPHDSNKEIEYKSEIPKDFNIIEKSLFESILDQLNSLHNNQDLNSDYLFEVSFACNYALIKNSKTNEIFIYSIEEEKYKIEYIISLEKDVSIKNLFDKCKNFDDFFNKYNLNLLKKEEQEIKIDDGKKNKKKEKKLGIFICLNPKEDNNIEEDNEEEEKKEEIPKEKKGKKKKKRPSNNDKNPEESNPVHCLGLENIGATCYMNATIQCLCNVEKLKSFFLNNSLVNAVTMNKNCPLTLEFSSLINHLWKLPKDNNNKSYYNPTNFKNIISQMDNLFQGIAANDSKDLIIFIYENIHREINTILYNNNQFNIFNCNNDYDLFNFRNSYYPINNSIIADTFYFEQQNCLKCTLCNYTKISYNITNILIFPLEKVRQYVYQISNGQCNSVSLDQCFMQNQIGEGLIGENQIYCNQCHNMADAISVNYINTSPEVLTIILNRGKGLEFNVDFHFEHYINIDNYVLDKTNNRSNLYELICILCHYGPSGMSGHFIAFCKSPVDKMWYCYNDASVTKCEGDPDITKYGNVEGIPYVLYYQRCGQNNNSNNNYNISINNNVQNGNNISIKEQMKNYTLANQNNNNFSTNENIKTNDSNNESNNQKSKNNKGKISLSFMYEDNLYELDIERNKTIETLIKDLQKKFKIFKNKDIMVCSQKNNNMEPLNYDLKINECDLNDNDILIVIEM